MLRGDNAFQETQPTSFDRKALYLCYVYAFALYFLFLNYLQAFIRTTATIYKKIQDGVFNVSNEVSF